MNILIAEDDFVSRSLLQELLKEYGIPHIAADGQEAVDIFKKAVDLNRKFDLVCLDIMMPIKDGQTTLKEIRSIEDEKEIPYRDRCKIVMTTSLGDAKNVMGAYYELCDGYLVKPFRKDKLDAELKAIELI